MKRVGSRRVARKVGSYGEEDSPDSSGSSQNEASKPTVVKRPASGKFKKRSSLRISFGPEEPEGNDGNISSDAPAVVAPKKSHLGRIALEKSARLRAQSPLISDTTRPSDEERPSYSKDYIAELRKSTPSAPKDLKPSAEEEEEAKALDIASKFGPTALSSTNVPFIFPTQAEIEEKKARRRRLAQEAIADEDDAAQPWASDDDGEDEFRQHSNGTRPVHEDIVMAEGFDDFVEDGGIVWGPESEQEAQRQRRAEMAERIKDAQSSDEDASADSDDGRNAAFAAAQARAGRYGQKIEDEVDGSKTPPRITPLPQLDDVLNDLTNKLQTMKRTKETLLQKRQELENDKIQIEERKKYLQEQLQKTGEEYEKLRQESGLPALSSSDVNGGRLLAERGLDSLGTTPLASKSGVNSNDDDDDSFDEFNKNDDGE